MKRRTWRILSLIVALSFPSFTAEGALRFARPGSEPYCATVRPSHAELSVSGAGGWKGEVADLPVVELPAQGSEEEIMAVILSGAGGWASLVRDIGKTLVSRGIGVVGLSTLRYFWKKRTPSGAAADLERLLRYYLSAWHKEKVLLLGYSLGADVLPFMAGRLPADLKQRIALVALIGAGKAAIFELHLADLLGGGEPEGVPIEPELQRLRGQRVLCIFGVEEKESLCRDTATARWGIETMALPGGHHFGGDYHRIVDLLLDELYRSW